jgi:transglutaminase-like putative cysteine protease
MMRSLRSSVFFAVLLFSVSLQAQKTKPQLGKEPAWITRHVLDYNNSALDGEAEDGYTRLAYEQQVHLASQSTYFRKTLKVLSEAGVQNASEISISFDPLYEQVLLHAIKIIRGTQVLDRTDLSKVKTLQQENELSKHLYNGTYTALVVLEDVRKNDIIEYSYTLRGFNPVFGNKYVETYPVQYSVPVCHLFYKLIVPAQRSVSFKNFNTDIAPTVAATPAEKVYEWKLANVAAAITEEERTPAWYNPYPAIQVSEYKSWKEVADWAVNLFPFDGPVGAPLRQKIEELKKQYPTAEERAGAALRFVQDEVRYMGIEMGENSHRPNHPDKIFRQRFGDCKDKSYLLCTMLRAMGMEAYPVLINTNYKKIITTWLPRPTTFDHTTVQARINGTTYWFDPTISYQRGPLAGISFPDYAMGLVVRPATTALTEIPLKDKGLISVKEIFTVTDMSGLAQLEVITEYSGSFADDERSRFQNNSRQQVQKDYQEYYAAYMDKIKSDSVTYHDNEQTGVFTTKEYYTVRGFWEIENIKRKASVSPYIINAAVRELKDAGRTMPFALPYPARYKEEIEIRLPHEWNVRHYKKDIEEPYFTFHSKFSGKGNRISLVYEYETLKDHITPEETKDYTAAYNEFIDNSGFELTSTDETDTSWRFSSGGFDSGSGDFGVLYVILGLCVLITIAVRRGR